MSLKLYHFNGPCHIFVFFFCEWTKDALEFLCPNAGSRANKRIIGTICVAVQYKRVSMCGLCAVLPFTAYSLTIRHCLLSLVVLLKYFSTALAQLPTFRLK